LPPHSEFPHPYSTDQAPMAQQLIKVPPTKNTLLRLKKQVAFLEEGHTLLERKRDLLTRLVYERVGEYRKLRDQTRLAVKDAYRWLAVSRLKQSSRSLRQAAFGTKPMLQVDILPRRSLGVEYPSITSERLPMKPMGLLGTDSSFDQTREKMADAMVLLARLGELEMALNRLMEEQRKAQKRVNALKYNIIPRYRRTIRFIRSALEEEERNALFQIKVLREQGHA